MSWKNEMRLSCISLLAVVVLSGCASGPADTGSQSYCLASGEQRAFDCSSDSEQLSDSTIDWETQAQIKKMLADITYPILHDVSTTVSASGSEGEFVADARGYTIQLASFRTRQRLDTFLASLENHNNLYWITRDDGWHSVSFGFFEQYSQAKEMNGRMEARGIKTWLRPVEQRLLRSFYDRVLMVL